jgi:hypothetical protein
MKKGYQYQIEEYYVTADLRQRTKQIITVE